MSEHKWINERIDRLYDEYVAHGHTARGLVRRISYQVRDDYQAALDAAQRRIAELEHDRYVLIKLLEDGWPIDDIEAQINDAKQVWPMNESEGDDDE